MIGVRTLARERATPLSVPSGCLRCVVGLAVVPDKPRTEPVPALRLGASGSEFLAGVTRNGIHEPGLADVFGSSGSRPGGVERLISDPCLDRRQEGTGVEEDCLSVRLQMLATARRVQLLDR